MIGGLLIDAIVVGAIVAFEWAGPQLGAAHAVRRAIACAVGFVAAVLTRDPAGSIVEAVLGTSVDFSRLVAMLAVGFGAYFAASKLVQWRDAKRAERIFGGYDADEFGSPAIAAIDGALLGFCWAVLFIALLVLMPANNIVSRAAVQSFTGSVLIRQESALRWLAEGFPHYTQTLPKGQDGTVVGERDELPMHGDQEPQSLNREADLLLRFLNRERRANAVQTLTFNPDIAAVARRHASALVAARTLSYTTPSGGPLDSRVRAALGGAAGGFAEDIGIEVAWSHSAANAARSMLEDDERASRLLLDPRWSEVGIGVSDAGWFNGRIYVVLLVGPVEEGSGDDESEQLDGDEGAAAAVGEEPSDGEVDPFTGTAECPEPFDLDGDGAPDPESVDPACLQGSIDGGQ